MINEPEDIQFNPGSRELINKFWELRKSSTALELGTKTDFLIYIYIKFLNYV